MCGGDGVFVPVCVYAHVPHVFFTVALKGTSERPTEVWACLFASTQELGKSSGVWLIRLFLLKCQWKKIPQRKWSNNVNFFLEGGTDWGSFRQIIWQLPCCYDSNHTQEEQCTRKPRDGTFCLIVVFVIAFSLACFLFPGWCRTITEASHLLECLRLSSPMMHLSNYPLHKDSWPVHFSYRPTFPPLLLSPLWPSRAPPDVACDSLRVFLLHQVFFFVACIVLCLRPSLSTESFISAASWNTHNSQSYFYLTLSFFFFFHQG